jgi:SAM-dependent methyltransferase
MTAELNTQLRDATELPYSHTAAYYDLDWYADLSARDVPFYLEEAARSGSTVLDLGCGTGRVSLPLARHGYTVSGVDLSAQMLEEFRLKLAAEPRDVVQRLSIIQSDMSNFSLGHVFDLIVIPARSFQALLSEEAQRSCLRCIREHLAVGGTYVITAFKADGMINDPEFATERRRWEKPALRGSGLVTKFVRGKHVDLVRQIVEVEGIYRVRFPDGSQQEARDTITLRYYDFAGLKRLLNEEGLTIVRAYGDYDRRPLDRGSEIILVCRRSGIVPALRQLLARVRRRFLRRRSSASPRIAPSEAIF